MREVRDANQVAPQEKLCYLGGGSFGILEFRRSGSDERFRHKEAHTIRGEGISAIVEEASPDFVLMELRAER